MAALVLAWLAFSHLISAWRHAVDVPVEDEWELIGHARGLGAAFDPAWILAQQNEHRIVPTKLLIWTSYKLSGWDVAALERLNVLLLLVCAAVAAWAVWRATRGERPWLALLGAAAMLPAAVSINVLWGLQSAFHFMLLLTWAGVFVLFGGARGSLRRAVCGGLALVGAAYALASGLAAALAVAVAHAAWQLVPVEGEEAPRRRRIVAAAITLVLVAAGVGLYLIGYRTFASGPAIALPISGRFWRYGAELVAFGFGVDRISAPLAAAALAFTVLGPAAALVRARGRLAASEWLLLAAWLGFAASLASVAMGRGNLGDLTLAKSARYAELAAALVAPTLGLWHVAMRGVAPRRQALLFAVVFAGLLGGLSRGLAVDQAYAARAERLEAGRLCALRFYTEPGHPGACEQIYPWRPIPRLLERARALGLSFTRP